MQQSAAPIACASWPAAFVASAIVFAVYHEALKALPATLATKALPVSGPLTRKIIFRSWAV